MLVADEKLHIEEIPTDNVTALTIENMPKGKQEATLVQAGKTYSFMLDNTTQARRFAAFLTKKNPGISIQGTELEGEGTLSYLKRD